jgi:hypothetical protein
VRKDYPVEALGLGAAGFISADRATVLVAPNMSWHDEPLKARIEALIDLPVFVENDANAAAWGEARVARGRADPTSSSTRSAPASAAASSSTASCSAVTSASARSSAITGSIRAADPAAAASAAASSSTPPAAP